MALVALLAAGPTQAASRVVKRVVRGDAAGMLDRLANGGFEKRDQGGDTATAWGFWGEGYTLEQATTHSGAGAARCISADPELEYGAGQTVVLNQREPLPIAASGWSKAEDVSGSPSSGYSVYVDILYADDTPLWGQISAFDTGSHDWQRREVVVVPEKPIRELNVYGLFRGHTGTVYFDDFSVKELSLPAGGGLFDGVPVMAEAAPAAPEEGQLHEIQAGPGLSLQVRAGTGAVVVPGLQDGGFLLRDVAAGSDFLQPTCKTQANGQGLVISGDCPELGLSLSARLKGAHGALFVQGEVRDLRGEDRAIAVYFVFPADFAGGEFGRDMRHTEEIGRPTTYANTVTVGAGTNGKMSRYPIAPVTGNGRGLCIATPLDDPRVSRLAYDAASRELYAAFDLGLSEATGRFPSSATFSALLYALQPEWGFRAALAQYYELFPESFVKRVQKEGIWMPFTDIATVQRPDDFGFTFKEGNDNVAWDEAHGIYTFVYVEPMSHWLALAPEVPRTYDAALGELKRRADTDSQAQATLTSAATNADGTYQLSIQDAPWCDGALIINNADPDLLSDRPDAMTQAKHEFATIDRAFERASQTTTTAWRAYGDGFEVVGDTPRSGQRCVRCTNQPGQSHGLVQTVLVRQTEAEPLVGRVWSRAEGVTGEPSNSYALYLDLVHADGTPSWGHVAPFQPGTHGWEEAEVVVRPEKPVQTVTINLLLRNQHGGTAWFDDVFVGAEGEEENLAKEPGFEAPPEPPAPAELDGTYIDSFEMAATAQNYRREQWAYVDTPLTFSLNTRQVCSLGIFHTYEFERELAKRMHARGKLTFANAVLSGFAFPAHLLDVMGIETNWASGGNYTPNPDEVMNFRRALCYQKPYLLLLNTDYNAFKPEWVELYFKRCTFYAIFPSFFSHNAADDPYWQNPTLYNRDRPIFRKYIPVICDLNAAGWQPITHARITDGNSVYVERYGDDAADGLYLTLFNDSQGSSPYEVSIDTGSLGLGVGRTVAEDVLTGDELELIPEGDSLKITGRLAAEDVRAIRLSGR
jgi:hypothetical protein